MAADVTGTEMVRRGCETFLPVGIVEGIRCDLICEAFDPRADKLVDCPIATDTASEFALLIVVRAVGRVLLGITTSTERLLAGS